MSIYAFEMTTVLPAELYGIGAGLNEALSDNESVQSTGLPVTEMESFVNVLIV